jgi:hypothetical protein
VQPAAEAEPEANGRNLTAEVGRRIFSIPAAGLWGVVPASSLTVPNFFSLPWSIRRRSETTAHVHCGFI